MMRKNIGQLFVLTEDISVQSSSCKDFINENGHHERKSSELIPSLKL